MERFLENKVCIITGAAQGIGKSIADRFAGDGAIVYACDRQEGSMDVWAEQCAAAQGTRVIPLYFDVTDAAAVKSAFMSIFKREGRIDVQPGATGTVTLGYVLKDDSEITVDVTNLLDFSDTAKVTYKFAI